MLENENYAYDGPQSWYEQDEVHCATSPVQYRRCYGDVLNRFSDYLLTCLEGYGLEPDLLVPKLMHPKKVLEQTKIDSFPIDSIYQILAIYDRDTDVQTVHGLLPQLFALPQQLPWNISAQRLAHVFPLGEIAVVAPTTTAQFYDEKEHSSVARLAKIQVITTEQHDQLPRSPILQFPQR